MSKPAAVIRTLEDSPDWLDQRLLEAYLCTSYEITLTPFPAVRIGEANHALEDWLDKQNFKTYAFITAWNPGSKLLPSAENHWRNKRLEVDVQKDARLVLPGLHVDDAGGWPPEESFWVLDISAENAIRLGKKYGQNAIVWRQKDGLPELWWL